MITTTEAGLLDDIIANPDDDVPRLIYTDWLEEHGEDERAEFIRVQIELDRDNLRSAECKGQVFHSGYCQKEDWERCERSHLLKVRERAILGENVAPSGADYVYPRFHKWLDAWGVPRQVVRVAGFCDGPPYSFRRGFVAEIHGPLAVLEKHLPRLVREHPIERVRATDKEPWRQPEPPPTVFTWWNHRGRFNGLPEEVWELLDASPNKIYRHAKDYPTVEAAHADLSVALLKLARGRLLTQDVHLS